MLVLLSAEGHSIRAGAELAVYGALPVWFR